MGSEALVIATERLLLRQITRRSHWGMGIATEASAAWRDLAFDVLELERIVSMVMKEDVASRRVAEKLGRP